MDEERILISGIIFSPVTDSSVHQPVFSCLLIIWDLLLYAEELATIYFGALLPFSRWLEKKKSVGYDLFFLKWNNFWYCFHLSYTISFTAKQTQMKYIIIFRLIFCICYWKNTVLSLYEDVIFSLYFFSINHRTFLQIYKLCTRKNVSWAVHIMPNSFAMTPYQKVQNVLVCLFACLFVYLF